MLMFSLGFPVSNDLLDRCRRTGYQLRSIEAGDHAQPWEWRMSVSVDLLLKRQAPRVINVEWPPMGAVRGDGVADHARDRSAGNGQERRSEARGKGIS